MFKKVLNLIGIILIINILFILNVNAAQCEPDNAEATLSSSVWLTDSPINELDRSKTNIYKMTLSGKNAFCIDSDRHTTSGHKYVIDKSQAVDDEYKRAYTFAKNNVNSISGYAVAQAAFWLIQQRQFESNKLKKVAEEILVRKNCSNFYNASYCNNLTVNQIISQFARDGRDGLISSITFDVGSLVASYFQTSPMNIKLYVWVDSEDPSRKQRMIAPAVCDNVRDNYKCTKSDGTEVDITNEVENCINQGKNVTVCHSEIAQSVCGATTTDELKYVVKSGGSPAVCDFQTGNYHEYVDIGDGDAIRSGYNIDMGDPEGINKEYCNLFCLETKASQDFPNSISRGISIGTYVIWPTNPLTFDSQFRNNYPLKFSGEKKCYMVLSGYNEIAKTENTINHTDIKSIINDLKRKLTNTDSQFKSSYLNGTSYTAASSNVDHFDYMRRQNWKCEDVYSTGDGGACKKTYDEKVTAETAFNNLSQDYKDAKNEKDRYTTCVAIGGRNCEDIVYDADKASEYENKKSAKDTTETAYNACKDQKNYCDNYYKAINDLIAVGEALKVCANYSPACSGESCEVYNFQTNIDLSWNDGEYGTTISNNNLEKKVNYNLSIQNPGQVNTVISKSSTRQTIQTTVENIYKDTKNITAKKVYIANVDVSYSLPTSNLIYSYVVKDNNTHKVQTEAPNRTNYSRIRWSNLPVSLKAEVGKAYDLTISNIVFGDNGQYSPSEPYVCHYNVIDGSSGCVCPPGTKNAGQDLSSIVNNGNKTCLQAQEEYCDDTPNEMFCKNECSGITYNLTTCYAELGRTDYTFCYNKYCACQEKKYVCPDDSDMPGSDITEEVMSYIRMGVSETEAIKMAKPKCYNKGNPDIIIYRTISLENPFPSYDADGNSDLIPTLLVKGMFNNDIRGRYPGYNWRDKTLVQNHILKVTRQGNTYKGNQLYNAEPLYTFELTTSIIQKIRNYNKQQISKGGYADFKLDCKLNNSKACVSSFVHDATLSGLISGECKDSTSGNKELTTYFYSCSGDN